jgi:hypothetical protein
MIAGSGAAGKVAQLIAEPLMTILQSHLPIATSLSSCPVLHLLQYQQRFRNFVFAGHALNYAHFVDRFALFIPLLFNHETCAQPRNTIFNF